MFKGLGLLKAAVTKHQDGNSAHSKYNDPSNNKVIMMSKEMLSPPVSQPTAEEDAEAPARQRTRRKSLLDSLLSFLTNASNSSPSTAAEGSLVTTAASPASDYDGKQFPVLAASNSLSHNYRLQMDKKLGKGVYGGVYVAIHRLTSRKVAVKRLLKNRLNEDGLAVQRVFREIMIHKSLQHPHICRLLDVVDGSDAIDLVLEYCDGGDLFEYIESRGALPEGEARQLFRQLIGAVEYCHLNGVVHRDIKADNILLTACRGCSSASLAVKLIDFGFSNTFDLSQQEQRKTLLHTFCGSVDYAAPELLCSKPYLGPAVDIWATGVVLFTMCAGYLPFHDERVPRIYSNVISARYSCPERISADCKDLLAKILKVEPAERIQILDMLQHPWLLKEPATATPPLPSPELSTDDSLLDKCASLLSLSKEAVRAAIVENEPSPILTAAFLLSQIEK